MKNLIIISLLALTFLKCTPSKETKLDKYVYDYENVLNEDQENQLNDLFKKHNEKTTNDIILVTTDSYGDWENIDIYSTEYLNLNKIGDEDKKNRLLIVFSNANSEVRISTETGLDYLVKKGITKMIVDSIMLPQYKEEKNFEGLWLGSQEIVKYLEDPDIKN